MPTWPATKASTTNLDAGTDKPSLARADIKQNVDNVNDIIDMFYITTPSNNQILKYNSSNSRFELASDTDTGITDVVQDTTPQLGGNLDVNGQSIVSVSNGNITITPNGTGSIVLDGQNWPQADGTANQVLKTNGSGQLSWTTVSAGATTLDGLTDVTVTTPSTGQLLYYNGATSQWVNQTVSYLSSVNGDTSPVLGGDLSIGNYKIVSASNGNIEIQPNGTGDVYLTADTVRVGDSNADATITTNGTGDLILNTNAGTNSGSITIADGTNGDITVVTNGTGTVNFSDKVVRQATLKDYAETVYNIGNSGGSLALDPANGNLQRIRLTSSWTFTGFTNGVSGHTVTVMVVQDGTGGRTFTESLSSNNAMLWAGGTSTLSTGGNSIDFLTITLIDSVYYASLAKGFA